MANFEIIDGKDMLITFSNSEKVSMKSINITNFEIIEGKGAHMTFANGVCVSIQIGAINYCDNHYKWGVTDYAKQKEDIKNNIFPTSKTCETAIIMPDGSLLDYKGDNVQGYQTPQDVLKTLDFASKIKT